MLLKSEGFSRSSNMLHLTRREAVRLAMYNIKELGVRS
jgi:hypothetical protein